MVEISKRWRFILLITDLGRVEEEKSQGFLKGLECHGGYRSFRPGYLAPYFESFSALQM